MSTALAKINTKNEMVTLSGWDDREKASARPLDGRFPKFGEEVRRLLGWTDTSRPYLSTRMAARKTTINHATIATMARGDRPSPDSIAKFAEGLGGDYAILMHLAGYGPSESLVRQIADLQSVVPTAPNGEMLLDPKEIAFKDYVSVVGGYDGNTTKFTEEEERKLQQAMEQMIAKAFAEKQRNEGKGKKD